jgi:uncharacterized protein YjcR
MADKSAVLADYRAGMRVVDIRDKHGVSLGTINSWARKAGLRRNGTSSVRKSEKDPEALSGGKWVPDDRGIARWVPND